MNQYTIISAAEAEQRFHISALIEYPYLDFADDQEIRLYEGDVTISGNFETDPDEDWNPFNIIVAGNLTVEGTIHWRGYGNGNFLLVTGNTRAQNVIASGCPNLYFRGNLTVGNTIMTSHGDDGGTLNVDGNLTANILLNCFYYRTFVQGKVQALVLSDEHEVDFPVDFTSEEFEDILIEDALDDDGEFSPRILHDFIAGNRRFLRDGVVSPHVAAAKELEKLIKKPLGQDPRAVEELDLSQKRLRAFPEAVTQFTNLKVLNLANNDKVSNLPASMGALIKLEKLNISSTSINAIPDEVCNLPELHELVLENVYYITTLPEAFGNLTALRTLSLAGATRLPALPESFGNLTALQSLNLSAVPAVHSLPSSISNLSALETLVLEHCAKNSEPIPPPIFELKNLRSLNLASNQWKEIPDDLLKLTNLEELDLTRALGGLEHIADLSKLPRLRRLKFTGYSANNIFPQHDVIATALACEHLEELSLDRWGEETKYDSTLDDQVVIREDLKKLPDDAFAKMPNLKWLDLSFNGIEELPESFFQLKHLEFVDLRYSRLNRETLERIARDCSHIRIDLRNLKSNHDPDFLKTFES